jgi:outer membrane protein TolC
MKKSIALCILVFVAFSLPAEAAQNWVQEFLNRYRPPRTGAPLGATSPQGLQTLAQAGVIPLSISDLISLTLRNNLDIATNRLSPVTLAYLTDIAYRPFEPSVRFGASLGRDTQAARSLLAGTAAESQLSHNFNIGFFQTLQTGTDVAVDFTLARSSSNNSFFTVNPAWSGQMRYTLTQRFLRDFGRSVNNRQIRIAQNNKTISEVQFEQQVIDLVVQAQKTYWDLVFTAEDQKVKQRSLDLAQQTLSDNKIQVQIGTLAPIDLIQAERQVAVTREDMIVATYTQTQIEDQIKKLASTEPDPGIVLTRVSPTQGAALPVVGDVLPVDQAIRVAIENRPELRRTALEVQNNDIDIEYARNQLLPSVNFNASYVQNGLGGRETIRAGFGDPTIISVNPGGPGGAFRQIFGFDFTGYSIGFDVQIPLRNRAAQAEYSRAVSEKKTTESRVKALEQQIAIEVRNAITQVEMTRARIDAAQVSRQLAEQQLSAEERKFKLGASTVRIVLEEQRNVTQMQTNEIAALINYSKALVDYDRALGMTLSKHNVVIEKTLQAAE